MAGPSVAVSEGALALATISNALLAGDLDIVLGVGGG